MRLSQAADTCTFCTRSPSCFLSHVARSSYSFTLSWAPLSQNDSRCFGAPENQITDHTRGREACFLRQLRHHGVIAHYVCAWVPPALHKLAIHALHSTCCKVRIWNFHAVGRSVHEAEPQRPGISRAKVVGVRHMSKLPRTSGHASKCIPTEPQRTTTIVLRVPQIAEFQNTQTQTVQAPPCPSSHLRSCPGRGRPSREVHLGHKRLRPGISFKIKPQNILELTSQ